MREEKKNEYPKASDYVVNGAIFTYIGGLCLLISFCSPYWVKSYTETFSSFKNMGLWEYCFDNFRYPYYQFDHYFDGCHHIFSEEYYVIREWLLPPWLMAVQTFVTISFLLTFGSQAVMTLQLCRWPLKFVLQNEQLLSIISYVCISTTTIFMLLAVIIFDASYTRRDWLMYPNFNFLSWSYGMACISSICHACAAFCLHREVTQNRERHLENRNLIKLESQSNMGWPS